jgi:hypothetical protein
MLNRADTLGRHTVFSIAIARVTVAPWRRRFGECILVAPTDLIKET